MNHIYMSYDKITAAFKNALGPQLKIDELIEFILTNQEFTRYLDSHFIKNSHLTLFDPGDLNTHFKRIFGPLMEGDVQRGDLDLFIVFVRRAQLYANIIINEQGFDSELAEFGLNHVAKLQGLAQKTAADDDMAADDWMVFQSAALYYVQQNHPEQFEQFAKKMAQFNDPTILTNDFYEKHFKEHQEAANLIGQIAICAQSILEEGYTPIAEGPEEVPDDPIPAESPTWASLTDIPMPSTLTSSDSSMEPLSETNPMDLPQSLSLENADQLMNEDPKPSQSNSAIEQLTKLFQDIGRAIKNACISLKEHLFGSKTEEKPEDDNHFKPH